MISLHRIITAPLSLPSDDFRLRAALPTTAKK
jgi:hypothetical protein